MTRRLTTTASGKLTRASKRVLRRIAARSWEDPVAAADARDALSLDRRNPPKDARYATTRIIRRPPPGERTTMVIRKRNPGRSHKKAMAAMARAQHARGRRRKKHTRDYDRLIMKRNPAHGERAEKKSRNGGPCRRGVEGRGYREDMITGWTKKERRRAERLAGKRGFKRDLLNPKRDGSPTRGEKRRVKYLSYLKTIHTKGQDAAAAIGRLTGEMAKTKPADAYKPVGPRATKRVERLSEPEYLERRVEAEDALVPTPANDAPEPTEVRFIKSRLTDIDMLVKGAQDELRELDADSDLDADTITEIHGRIEKLAKQRKKLKDQLAGFGVTQNNPRRRGARKTFRVRRSTLHRLDKALRAFRSALTKLSRAARR